MAGFQFTTDYTLQIELNVFVCLCGLECHVSGVLIGERRIIVSVENNVSLLMLLCC